jgi:hypothetical protein
MLSHDDSRLKNKGSVRFFSHKVPRVIRVTQLAER